METTAYYHAVGSFLARSIRAMRDATRSGGLPKPYDTELPRRIQLALSLVDVIITPSLIARVTTVRVYRDGVVAPVIERTSFTRQQLTDAIKSINVNLDLTDEGVILNSRNGNRYGYIEILIDDVDVTRRVLDTLADARSLSERG